MTQQIRPERRPEVVSACLYCGGLFSGRPMLAALCRRCWWRGGVLQPATATDPTSRVLLDDPRDLAFLDLTRTLSSEAKRHADVVAVLRLARAQAEVRFRNAEVNAAWGWWAALVGACGSLGGAMMQSAVSDAVIVGGLLWFVAAGLLVSGLWGTPWWVLRGWRSLRRGGLASPRGGFDA